IAEFAEGRRLEAAPGMGIQVHPVAVVPDHPGNRIDGTERPRAAVIRVGRRDEVVAGPEPDLARAQSADQGPRFAQRLARLTEEIGAGDLVVLVPFQGATVARVVDETTAAFGHGVVVEARDQADTAAAHGEALRVLQADAAIAALEFHDAT